MSTAYWSPLRSATFGGSLAPAKWHLLAWVYIAPTPTTEGALQLYANAVLVAASTIPAGVVPTIETTNDVIVGAFSGSVFADFQSLTTLS